MLLYCTMKLAVVIKQRLCHNSKRKQFKMSSLLLSSQFWGLMLACYQLSVPLGLIWQIWPIWFDFPSMLLPTLGLELRTLHFPAWSETNRGFGAAVLPSRYFIPLHVCARSSFHMCLSVWVNIIPPTDPIKGIMKMCVALLTVTSCWSSEYYGCHYQTAWACHTSSHTNSL